MAIQILLLKDIPRGRKGQVVNVAPGYFRNFLLPQAFAVRATRDTLRRQKKLQEERAQQAVVDQQQSRELADKMAGLVVTAVVKVDQEGHMYGSVSVNDLLHLLQEQASMSALEKSNIVLKHPIKQLGEHTISLKLKEGVTGSFVVNIIPEQIPGKL